MSSEWPDGWMTAALTEAGLPVTDFTLSALGAWQRSTPILPYTNNPIGMPFVKGKNTQLMQTGYGMFVTMGAFRDAFSAFIASASGQGVHDAFALSEQYPQVWRAVSALKWPASRTETDYPSAVLDLTSQSYRDKVASVQSPADRKTSGTIGSQTALGSGAAYSSRVAAETANTVQQAISYMRQIPGRLG